MKATHTVKINGAWYHAGDELPTSTAEPIPEPPKETEKVSPAAYTKQQLNAMKANELRKLAVEHGLENADDMTGSELKGWLTERLG